MKPVSFKPISFTRSEIEEVIQKTLEGYELSTDNDKDSVAYYCMSGFAAGLQSNLIELEIKKLKEVK